MRMCAPVARAHVPRRQRAPPPRLPEPLPLRQPPAAACTPRPDLRLFPAPTLRQPADAGTRRGRLDWGEDKCCVSSFSSPRFGLLSLSCWGFFFSVIRCNRKQICFPVKTCKKKSFKKNNKQRKRKQHNNNLDPICAPSSTTSGLGTAGPLGSEASPPGGPGPLTGSKDDPLFSPLTKSDLTTKRNTKVSTIYSQI